MKKDDLKLKDLRQFYGTEKYYKGFLDVKYTDGVYYISDNGYSWFVTDSIAVIKTKLKDEGFLSIKLMIDGDKAVMTIDDGNNNILYKQKYEYTNCKRNLNLFFTNNVLMLSSEY